MSIAAPAQTHDGKVEAIVGAEYLAVTFAEEPIAKPAAPTASESRNSRRLTILFLLYDNRS